MEISKDVDRDREREKEVEIEVRRRRPTKAKMNFRSEGPIQLGYSTIYVLPVAPGSFASPQKSLFNFRTVAIYAFPQTSNSASATAQRRTCTGYW